MILLTFLDILFTKPMVLPLYCTFGKCPNFEGPFLPFFVRVQSSTFFSCLRNFVLFPMSHKSCQNSDFFDTYAALKRYFKNSTKITIISDTVIRPTSHPPRGLGLGGPHNHVKFGWNRLPPSRVMAQGTKFSVLKEWKIQIWGLSCREWSSRLGFHPRATPI